MPRDSFYIFIKTFNENSLPWWVHKSLMEVDKSNVGLQPSLMLADKTNGSSQPSLMIVDKAKCWSAAITDGCGQILMLVCSHHWWLRTKQMAPLMVLDKTNGRSQPSLMVADKQIFVRSHHRWLRTNKYSFAAITDGCEQIFAFEKQNGRKCSLPWKNGK